MVPRNLRTQYSSPPLSAGNVFQEPQWMPETVDCTEPYTVFLHVHVKTYDKAMN